MQHVEVSLKLRNTVRYLKAIEQVLTAVCFIKLNFLPALLDKNYERNFY